MPAWVAISFSRQCIYIVLQFSFPYLTFHCGRFIFHDGTFISSIVSISWDFPGSPVVKTLPSNSEFSTWSES